MNFTDIIEFATQLRAQAGQPSGFVSHAPVDGTNGGISVTTDLLSYDATKIYYVMWMHFGCISAGNDSSTKWIINWKDAANNSIIMGDSIPWPRGATALNGVTGFFKQDFFTWGIEAEKIGLTVPTGQYGFAGFEMIFG